MNKFISHPGLLHLCLIIILVSSCTSNNHSEKKTSYGEATNELIEMVNKNLGLKSMLALSIEKAKEINPDTVTNPAQSLEEFYDYASKMERCVPWAIVIDPQHPSPFNNMSAALAAFYFPIDQPLPQLESEEYFNNSVEYAEPFTSWLTKFNKSWRKYLDSDSSWNDNYYQVISKDSAFGLQNGWYEDPSHWKTFNQFFARRLSSPAARPIASPDDNSVVASFADAVPQGVWAIDSNSNTVDKKGVAIKSASIKSIAKLLDESKYKDSFANGILTHSFLNVNDYHRYHFPVSGIIKEARVIQATNPTGGVLTWNSSEKRYVFDPSVAGWQMLESRGCVILQTNEYGLVALLPIGMATVGSVNFMDNVKVGTSVKKVIC